MVETWKDIKGYEGLYQISNLGRIKSLRKKIKNNGAFGKRKIITKNEKIVSSYKNKDGYSVVQLYKNNKRKLKLVHRLVAEAFIPNPNNYPYVNHKDGNKANNCVDNLEWCNNSMNQLHAFSKGLQKCGCDHAKAKLKYEDVLFIKNNINKYQQTELAKMFNVSRKVIYQIKKGITYKNIK